MLSPSKVWLAGFDFKQGGFGVVTKTDQTAPTSRRGRGGVFRCYLLMLCMSACTHNT
jgi:hypothetical protein